MIVSQRRFAYENPHLLSRGEDDEQTGTAEAITPDPSTPTPSRSNTPSAPDQAENPRPRKRKRVGMKKGEDFWSQVDAWVKDKRRIWGSSYNDDGWQT